MDYETLRGSMTVQDAAEVLKDTNCYGTMDIAKNVILKALEGHPTKRTEERTETHACDCISRKAVLDALHSYFAEGFNEDRWWNSTYVLDAINKVPSIAPQPKAEQQQKTGHWVLSGGYWRCSECKEKALLKLDKATGGFREYEPVRSKYCPNCGAKMQEVKE